MKKNLINIHIILTLILIIKNYTLYPNKIYINSIPKCGTHLLTKCIKLITNKKPRGFKSLNNNELPEINNNEFFFCHIRYSAEFEKKLENQNYKILFIYRDPRDQIVSNACWVREKEFRYKLFGYKEIPTVDELINFFIKHINNVYKSFLPWTNNKSVCSVKFENLIGPKGQGNLKLQRSELRKICNFIEVKNPKIRYYVNNLFGGTGTFRIGQIGRWKEYFSQTQKNEFKKNAGQLLIDLGYEKDFNW